MEQNTQYLTSWFPCRIPWGRRPGGIAAVEPTSWILRILFHRYWFLVLYHNCTPKIAFCYNSAKSQSESIRSRWIFSWPMEYSSLYSARQVSVLYKYLFTRPLNKHRGIKATAPRSGRSVCSSPLGDWAKWNKLGLRPRVFYLGPITSSCWTLMSDCRAFLLWTCLDRIPCHFPLAGVG